MKREKDNDTNLSLQYVMQGRNLLMQGENSAAISNFMTAINLTQEIAEELEHEFVVSAWLPSPKHSIIKRVAVHAD